MVVAATVVVVVAAVAEAVGAAVHPHEVVHKLL
jgi:hypothetical protein